MTRKKRFQIIISPIIGLLSIIFLIIGSISLKLKEDCSKKLTQYHYVNYNLHNIEKYFQALINIHQAEIYYTLSKRNKKLKIKSENILEQTLNLLDDQKLKKDLEVLINKIKHNQAQTFDFAFLIGKLEKRIFKNLQGKGSFSFPLKFKDLQNEEENLYWHLQDFSKTFVTNSNISKDYIYHLIRLLKFYYSEDFIQKCNLHFDKNMFNSTNLIDNLINCIFEDLKNQFYIFLKNTKMELLEEETKLQKKEKFYERLSIISILFGVILVISSLILFCKERKKMEELLIKDDLTNTLNRDVFFEYTKNKKGYIIILDLVKFKRFNEIYGRKSGDNLLRLIAERIKSVFKDFNPLISRFWSNTFVIFIPSQDKKFKDYAFLKSIKDKLEKPIYLENGLEYIPKFTMVVKEKIDCSKCLKNSCDFFSFVEYLEDYAKNQSKGSIVIYEGHADFRLKLEDIMEKEKILQKAIKEQKVIAYFQPIVDSKTYKPYAFECLARIVDNNKVLPAGMFIDVAIETGLILDIDIQMLKYISKIRKELPVKLFVNLSPKSLYSKHILEELKNIYLGNTVFEITEQFILENLEQIEKLRKELNLDFAIDDFGTGFSSLHTVLDLSIRGIIKYLKIDGSLVKDLKINKKKQEIVETIVIMARKLHLKTIAEFVEDEETAKLLNKLGVDYLQGYYFSPPMPFEKVKEYLEKLKNDK